MSLSLRKKNNFLKFFPVPHYLSFAPFGLDISPKVLRALRLKHAKAGSVPDTHKEIVLKEVCNLLETDEDLKDCDGLRKGLRALKKELDITFVSVSLPEMKTYIFKTALPQEALPTIEDALTVKIQENVPLNMENIIFTYDLKKEFLLPNGYVEVVVTVFPKKVIDTYTKLLHEEGMVPLSFESESQAIARSVIDTNDMTSYLLINLGYAQVNLTIVEHGIVHYTSSIPYSGEEIVKDFEGKSAQMLKTKINQLLIYWFTNKHDPENEEKIYRAIVAGPFASAQGVTAFLEKSLRINVQMANVWTNCFDLDEHVPVMSKKMSLRYATAIGLSLIHT